MLKLENAPLSTLTASSNCSSQSEESGCVLWVFFFFTFGYESGTCTWYFVLLTEYFSTRLFYTIAHAQVWYIWYIDSCPNVVQASLKLSLLSPNSET